jgi:hypothetical protein
MLARLLLIDTRVSELALNWRAYPHWRRFCHDSRSPRTGALDDDSAPLAKTSERLTRLINGGG